MERMRIVLSIVPGRRLRRESQVFVVRGHSVHEGALERPRSCESQE